MLFITKCWCYDLPKAKDAIEKRKLQSGFDSDASLTVMKGATLSTFSSTGKRYSIFEYTKH